MVFIPYFVFYARIALAEIVLPVRSRMTWDVNAHLNTNLTVLFKCVNHVTKRFIMNFYGERHVFRYVDKCNKISLQPPLKNVWRNTQDNTWWLPFWKYLFDIKADYNMCYQTGLITLWNKKTSCFKIKFKNVKPHAILCKVHKVIRNGHNGYNHMQCCNRRFHEPFLVVVFIFKKNGKICHDPASHK